ncbi:MAG: hypothetical protein WCK78_17730 [Paludibacter sp.]
MTNDKQLEQFSNLANDVENLLDKIERKTGFQNILKKIHSFIPKSIDNNLSNINLNDGYKLSDYRISRYHDFWEIIRFVKDNIEVIKEYENDDEDKRQERNIKQKEFSQFIFPKDKVVKRTQHYGLKTWVEEETEEDPNWIYSCYGTYTKYLSKKSHWYYPICLNLALSNSNLDFETHNGYVLLYIAVNNELKSLTAVLDILGIGKSENQIYPTTTPELRDSTNNSTINTNHSSMNYKQVVLNAYTEHREQKTSYQSYFKREAQIAKRDYFVEFSDYFDGCQNVLESYKNEIIRKYKKRLTEDDWVVSSVKSGSGINFDGEIVTDLMDERIQDSLRRIADDKEYVQNKGYTNNLDYECNLTETGEITNSVWEYSNVRGLYWQDIVQIEQGVNQAKDELSVQDQKNIIDTKNTKFKPAEFSIDVDTLSLYFKSTFLGIGEYNLNHFETLMSDIETLRKPVEFAEVALMIHESKFVNNRMPVHFSDWYPIFCNCVGCEQKKYQPKDLRPARESIQKLFSYLLL